MIPKLKPKRFFSVLCAAALISGLSMPILNNEIVTEAATLESVGATSVKVDFDNMPEYFTKNTKDTYVTSEDFSFVDNVGIGGSRALKRKLLNSKLGDNKYQLLNDGEYSLTIETNTVYMVKMRYKLLQPGDAITVNLRCAVKGNYSTGFKDLGQTTLKTECGGNWDTQVLYFTSPSSFKKDSTGKKCNSLYLGLNGKGASEVLFDDIEVIRVGKKSANYSLLFLDYGIEGVNETVVGKAGDALNLTLPDRGEKYVFTGWSSDREGNNPVSAPTALESGMKTVYAQWYSAEPKTVTFDDVPEALQHDTPDTLVSDGFSFAEGVGIDGSIALKRDNPRTKSQLLQALNDKNGYLTVKSNTTYRLQYSYYIASGTGQIYSALATARAGNSWYNRKYLMIDRALNMKTGVWITDETVFKTGDLGVDHCLYFGYSGDLKTVVYTDNIKLQELAPDDVLLEYRIPNLKVTHYSIGKAGEPITDIPDVSNKNYEFGGWFTDEEFTVPFNETVYPQKGCIVYGDVRMKDVLAVGFVDYPFAGTNDINGQFSGTVFELSNEKSSDGDGYSIKFDNSRKGQSRYEVPLLLNIGEEPLYVENNTKYLITFDFCFENATDEEMFFCFATNDPKNRWNKASKFTDRYCFIASNFLHETWVTGACVGTTAVKEGMNALSAYIQIPRSAIMYIDNIQIRKLSEDECAVLYLSDCGSMMEPEIVKKGTEINVPNGLSTVPNGKKFVEWETGGESFTGSAVTADSDMIFTGKTRTLSAFEGFESTAYMLRGITGFGNDQDWEIYDSSAKGNSKGNVSSGRYALHRIGAEPAYKSYNLHGNRYMSPYILEEFKKYILSYRIKVENPVHTNGAIGIRSTKSPSDPWTFIGSEQYTTSVKAVADGKWHEVSFTFIATSPYLALITPGNLSIYIDDISLTLDETDTPISQDAVFEEYTPSFISDSLTDNSFDLEDFVLVKVDHKEVDFDTDINEDEAYETEDTETEDTPNTTKRTIVRKMMRKKKSKPFYEEYLTQIIIAAGALAAVGAAVTVLIIVKRKKSGKGAGKA